MPISVLEPQKAYQLTGFAATMTPAYRHKLLSMGIRPGIWFRIVRIAPLGDPVQLEIGRLNVMLRKKDLEQLTVGVPVDAVA
jgi:ferrous iron transport protein A